MLMRYSSGPGREYHAISACPVGCSAMAVAPPYVAVVPTTWTGSKLWPASCETRASILWTRCQATTTVLPDIATHRLVPERPAPRPPPYGGGGGFGDSRRASPNRPPLAREATIATRGRRFGPGLP